MPLDAMGRFTPQVAMAANQAVQPTATRQPLAMSANRAMIQASPFAQNQQTFNAYQRPISGNFQTVNPALLASLRQPQAPNPNPPQPPPAPPPPPPPVQGQQAVRPTVGPAPVQVYGMSQLGAPGTVPQQAPMPGPSATQMAGRGNAQSVSNYLTALQQAGAQTNNAAMNAPNQMGAGPQAGFAGFGNQPGYGPNYIPQGYLGAMPSGLSYQGNQASFNPNYNIGNYAGQGYVGQANAPQLANEGGVSSVNAPGLLAGAQNAPQFTIPQPWGNPINNPPGSPGSGWGGGSTEDWQNYFFANSPNAPGYQQQVGSMYSNQPTNNGGDIVTSDVAAKTNIQSGENDLQEFLDALGVYSYEYKDKKYGEGKRISPMAQEIEKTPLGAAAISTNAEGYKQVDYGKLAGTQLAALALLNHKYNQLEAKLKQAIGENLKKRGK